MPTFEYRCTQCNDKFEIFHLKRPIELPKCPKCKGEAKQIISKPAENPFGSISWFKHS